MSDDHVCTGACAPGFHPSVPPANDWGRQGATTPALADAQEELARGGLPRWVYPS